MFGQFLPDDWQPPDTSLLLLDDGVQPRRGVCRTVTYVTAVTPVTSVIHVTFGSR